MRITVKTGAADRPAPDITDALLSSTESKLERGKAELYGAVDSYISTVALPLQTMMNTGKLVEIHDYQYGTQYTGKIEGIAIDISPQNIEIKIDVERPA